MRMSTLVLIVLLNLCLLSGCSAIPNGNGPSNGITQAFERHESNVQVIGEGVVSRLLADDTTGLTHQRFIVRISSEQTVLIAYNTDVALRIEDLKVGDKVSFAGEYIWNEQGGLIHWTHRDPAGKHTAGWLKHNGRTYR